MIFEHYHKYERLYKVEQEKARLRLSIMTADQIKEDYNKLKSDLIEYRDSKNKNHFSNCSFSELICLYIFFWRFQRDLNKLKNISVFDNDMALNVISSLYGYKSLLDVLIETDINRCMGKKEV